ncbi:hypothetical protein [Micromonospora avicenniae]|uniref:hypothetical protein n=1 Tax=Micromonospora avicenniae TaxID=1198245 RepID=UPI0034381743
MAERPSGPLAMRHFRSEVVPVPPRPADAVLLRNIFVSVAPGARAAMQGAAYRPQLVPGEVIPSSVIAEVMAAPPGGPEPGSIVGGAGGWQEYSVVPTSEIWPLEPVGELSHHLGLLGRNGLTAYFGIREVAQLRAGETVVVLARPVAWDTSPGNSPGSPAPGWSASPAPPRRTRSSGSNWATPRR